MAWLLLVIALGLVVGFVIIFYGYRKSVIGAFAVLSVLLLVIIWYAEFYKGRNPELIGQDQVDLDRFEVSRSYGDTYKVTARIRNRSEKYHLSAVGVVVTASDCAQVQGDFECVVVGEREREIRVSVPAQQARDIVELFQFPPIRPEGELRWEHRVTYTRAE